MWLIVLNRSSGRGNVDRKLRRFTELCKQNNVSYEIVDKDSAAETSYAIRERLSAGTVEAVIAFGGDGIVSLCLQLVAKSSIGFCVVPTGTGNDFARSIGTYKKSIKSIFHAICFDKPISMDIAAADNFTEKRYFVQVLSSGFDASVNELANTIKAPIGRLKYTIAMLLKLPRFKSIEFEVLIDSQKLNMNSMLVVVANGSSYGGGMKILPNASFQDGKLDLLYVDPVSKFTLLSIFPLVFKGWHLKHPAVHVVSAKSIELRGVTSAYADGEFVSNLPLKISVIQNGLQAWICR
jgi:diacylglycerol kinase (ATP)